jgi:hypothetical protein
MIFDTVLGWTVEGKSEVSALGLKLKVGLLSPTLFALVLFLGWRLLRRADGKAREALTSLLRKPLQLALVFFLVAAGVGFFADGVLHYWIGRAFYGAPPPLHWTDILVRLNSLLPSAAAAGFTLILARKRLRIRVT